MSCRILETPSVEMFVSVVLRGREIKTEKLNSKVFRNHNPVKIMHRPGCGQFYVETFSVQRVILHHGIVECLLLLMD